MSPPEPLPLRGYTPGSPPVPCSAEPVFLFTDLHLDPARPEECARFAAQLDALAPRAAGAAVVVMGDLFDAYAGPEDWDLPPFAAILAALRGLKRAGARVILLRGNRDVMLEASHLPAGCGVEVEDGVLSTDAGRRPALITHGDAFCLADGRYQFLRRRLRGPRLRRFLLARSAGFRRWLAARLRGISRGEAARKPLTDYQVAPAAVRHALAASSAGQAVIGHLHHRRTDRWEGGAALHVLPAWDPQAPPWELAAVLDAEA